MEYQIKEIKDYAHYYEIDNCGNIYSKERVIEYDYNGSKRTRTAKRKELKKFKDKYGYLVIHLYCKNKKSKTLKIHRLVMATFNKKSKLDINHIDGNKENNKLSNLEYCTRAENNLHKYRVLGHKGLSRDNHFNTKIKEKDILDIKKMKNEGRAVEDIAQIYNVGIRAIYKILKK